MSTFQFLYEYLPVYNIMGEEGPTVLTLDEVVSPGPRNYFNGRKMGELIVQFVIFCEL